jgi:hypothetical protein
MPLKLRSSAGCGSRHRRDNAPRVQQRASAAAACLVVDRVPRLLREVARLARLRAEERGPAAAAPRHLAELVAEAHLLYHHARGARDLLEVAARARRDVVLTKDKLLRNAAAHGHRHLVLEVLHASACTFSTSIQQHRYPHVQAHTAPTLRQLR